MIEFPYGKILDEIPADFFPPETWPEYTTYVHISPLERRELVGINPMGERWAFWPLCFEEYWGDTPPDLLESKKGALARNRLMIWRPIHQSKIPNGWHVIWKRPTRIDGFSKVSAVGDYRKNWSRIAKRHLREWQTKHARLYTIEPISIDEYEAAYKKSTVKKKIGPGQFETFKARMVQPHPKDTIQLRGVRNKKTGEIVGGLGMYYSPTRKSSAHACPFLTNEGKCVHAMIALTDRWFTDARERQITTLIFPCFWFPSEPKSWKGFSEFKSHFGLQYVAYPPTLLRFMPGKIF